MGRGSGEVGGGRVEGGRVEGGRQRGAVRSGADGGDEVGIGDAAAEVVRAVEARAAALGAGDRAGLAALLHPGFRWVSHRGDEFDRAAYLDANTADAGATRWHAQRIEHLEVTVIGDAAVAHMTVADDVTTSVGREIFRMPVTQTWVRTPEGWQCLAGHAGPRLGDDPEASAG